MYLPVINLAESKRVAVKLDAVEEENWQVAVSFYAALRAGDARKVQSLLASQDLEWWFHGPPCEQHLMKLLTGATSTQSFVFTPVSVCPIGNTVFVEGQGPKGTPQENKCWVHVWTIKHGKITHLREYFNTSLTVLKPSSSHALHVPLWQSQLHTKSNPSLILAM
eukprot:c15326_g1_i1 orf=347-841(-)